MMMFCGLPVIVATLPIFDAVATASRYGMGWRLTAVTSSSTSGVITKQIVSFTKKAESVPDASAMATSSASGRRTCVAIQSVTRRKKPQTRRLATTIIMPSKSVMVSKSIAR